MSDVVTMRVVDGAGCIRTLIAERDACGWWAEHIGPVACGPTPRDAALALAAALGWGEVSVEVIR